MDNNFFKEQIQRLRGVYSQGSMPDERVSMLWNKFRNVENHVFRNAIDFLISEHTAQTMPAISKFAEAVGFFRTGVSAAMNILPSPFSCEACRDFGYGFVGDTLTRCVCSMGDRLSPEELVRQQKNYDRGKKFMDEKRFPGIGKSLPYDPSMSLSE